MSYWALFFPAVILLSNVNGQENNQTPTTRPATPTAYFFKAKVIGWQLVFKKSLHADGVARSDPDHGICMLQLFVTQEYGHVALGHYPGPSGWYELPLRGLPDVTIDEIKRTGDTAFPEILKTFGVVAGETYLVKTDAGQWNFDTFVTLIPFSQAAEQKFLLEYHEQIDCTLTYSKWVNRHTRQQYIDTYESVSRNLRSALAAKEVPENDLAFTKSQLADAQKKLEELRATPEDIFPPPSWRNQVVPLDITKAGTPPAPKPATTPSAQP